MKEYYRNFHDLNKPFYEKEPRPAEFENWVAMEGDFAVLASLINDFKIKSVFEIGTWKGYTSAMMLNLPTIKRIKAIDINDSFNLPNIGNPTHPLSSPEIYGEYAKKHAKLLKKKYELVFCDSKLYEPTEQFDLVFIDGDHSYEYVRTDTELAFKLKPKVIVWHDYPNEPGVQKRLDELKENYEIKTYDLEAPCLIVSLEIK